MKFIPCFFWSQRNASLPFKFGAQQVFMYVCKCFIKERFDETYYNQNRDCLLAKAGRSASCESRAGNEIHFLLFFFAAQRISGVHLAHNKFLCMFAAQSSK
jgi:hypothetical protein